jgi:hypothetical protein
MRGLTRSRPGKALDLKLHPASGAAAGRLTHRHRVASYRWSPGSRDGILARAPLSLALAAGHRLRLRLSLRIRPRHCGNGRWSALSSPPACCKAQDIPRVHGPPHSRRSARWLITARTPEPMASSATKPEWLCPAARHDRQARRGNRLRHAVTVLPPQENRLGIQPLDDIPLAALARERDRNTRPGGSARCQVRPALAGRRRRVAARSWASRRSLPTGRSRPARAIVLP